VVSHWPAYTNWNDEYLCSLAGDTEVTVALTPNGRADAVTPLPGSGGAGLSSNSSAATSPSSGSPTAVDADMAAAAAAEAAGGTGMPAECFALPHQVCGQDDCLSGEEGQPQLDLCPPTRLRWLLSISYNPLPA